MYVTEPDVVGVTASEPVAAWLPLHAPLAVQEAAWVLDHVSVADWPAVIEVGLTERVTVGVGADAGAGAGGAVYPLPPLPPLPPQAGNASVISAAAAAGQGSRIRKVVKIEDMLPRPSRVVHTEPDSRRAGFIP